MVTVDDPVQVAKQELRRNILQRRRAHPPSVDDAAALAAQAAAEPLIARARRIALYSSMPTEPPTGQLIADLISRGCEVMVPVVSTDHSLTWVVASFNGPTTTSELGIPEPNTGAVGSLSDCDVVLVPALAADHAGHRLGRGAGYYDRALTAVSVPIVAIVFTEELLPHIPHEPHDVRVNAVLTPSGMFRVPQTP